MPDPSPYEVPVSAQGAVIGGALPFEGPPSAENYMEQYQTALSQNQANYSNILSGYQSSQQAQQAMQQGIQQGYSTLSKNVLGTIKGIDQSQRQAIADAYAQQSGSAAQSLIDRGLGNTTVANAVQRGLSFDKAKADIALSNQMAQLTAGYQSSLGLAGLNYANQANMQNTGLRSQQLGYMAGLREPYPNNLGYANLQMQRDALQRAQQPGGGGYRVAGGGGGGRGMSPGPMIGGGGRGGGSPAGGGGPQRALAPMEYQYRPLGGPSGPQTLNFGGSAGLFSRAGSNPYLPGNAPSSPTVMGVSARAPANDYGWSQGYEDSYGNSIYDKPNDYGWSQGYEDSYGNSIYDQPNDYGWSQGYEDSYGNSIYDQPSYGSSYGQGYEGSYGNAIYDQPDYGSWQGYEDSYGDWY